MKIKEVREMDAKTLAETKENLQEKLAQMKLNHTVTLRTPLWKRWDRACRSRSYRRCCNTPPTRR